MRSFLTSLFKDARVVVLVGLVVFVVSVLAAHLKRDTYTATASLLVLGSDEYASRPATLTPQAAPPAALMNREAILSSEMSILTSRPVIRATVEKLGVARLYPDLNSDIGFLARLLGSAARVSPQDAAVDRFASKLQVKSDRSGSTIEVSYSHRKPDVASAAVNELVAAYHARRQSIYSSTESAVVEATVKQAREQLDAVSRELADFQATNGISNFDTQMDLLLRRMSDQTRALEAAQTESAELDKRLVSLKQQLESTPRSVIQYQDADPDRRVQTMRDSLAELRRQETELLQTYTDRSERVVNIRRQIQTMEQQISSAAGAGTPGGVRRGLNEVRTAIELELVRASSQAKAVNERRQALKAQVATIQAEVETMQAKAGRLSDLARQKSLAEQAFVDATKALQERRNMENLGARRAANVRTIEAAEPPAKADRTPLVIMLAGGFLSLLAALATAVLRHRMRDTYVDPAPLQRDTGVPVLGLVRDSGSQPPALQLPSA